MSPSTVRRPNPPPSPSQAAAAVVVAEGEGEEEEEAVVAEEGELACRPHGWAI